MKTFDDIVNAEIARGRKALQHTLTQIKPKPTQQAVKPAPPVSEEYSPEIKVKASKREAKAIPNPKHSQRRDSIQDRYVGKPRRLKVTRRRYPTQRATDVRRYQTLATPATTEEVREAARRERY